MGQAVVERAGVPQEPPRGLDSFRSLQSETLLHRVAISKRPFQQIGKHRPREGREASPKPGSRLSEDRASCLLGHGSSHATPVGQPPAGQSRPELSPAGGQQLGRELGRAKLLSDTISPSASQNKAS